MSLGVHAEVLKGAHAEQVADALISEIQNHHFDCTGTYHPLSTYPSAGVFMFNSFAIYTKADTSAIRIEMDSNLRPEIKITNFFRPLDSFGAVRFLDVDHEPIRFGDRVGVLSAVLPPNLRSISELILEISTYKNVGTITSPVIGLSEVADETTTCQVAL